MSRSSSNTSNAERRFREEMEENNSDDEYMFPQDEYEFAGEAARHQEPTDLLGQISTRGWAVFNANENQYEHRNRITPAEDITKYGYQRNGRYNMENFIAETLELDMSSQEVRWMDDEDRTNYIIEKAVETINSGRKKEIHFTPQENTDYKKIKLIYDKIASDLQKMICRRLKITPCPHKSDNVITAAQEKVPGILDLLKLLTKYQPGMTFGYKLKAIEEYLENRTRSEAKGKKTKRRRSLSKNKYDKKSKTKRRRARSRKM